ncbi:S8 family peptidase [Actinomadura flavalba]|uniref:S8 family peptidase n=1 Tax=Actinomadura flavalba TaxID=1120938 RepID=UPI0003827F26|nr:S8 family peptidase [Actinomadura flavalba]
MRPTSRRLLVIGVATALAGGTLAAPALADEPLVTVATVTDGTPVPGQYIVTLKDGASATAAAKRAAAKSVRQFPGRGGFAAKVDADGLNKLRRDPGVAAIEPDQIVRANTTQRSPLPWGLDRIDQRSVKRDKKYTYTATGKGVNAYVIDSGIDPTHPQFGGRASIAWAAPSFGGDGADCNGHGTHVSGTIGSKLHGVAKGVNLRGVRVLDCNGEGSLSDVIAAVNWVRTNAVKPAVANLSLGGSKSAALNTAVENLSRSKVFTVVSAGNDNVDSCKVSPASAGWVMAVGATTIYDNRAGFSNWGKCVDIFAPGYGITSTLPNNRTAAFDGTSMAAPHVAGVAALYLSKYKTADFPTVQKWLNTNATKVVKKLPSGKGTTNRLLYKAGL